MPKAHTRWTAPSPTHFENNKTVEPLTSAVPFPKPNSNLAGTGNNSLAAASTPGSCDSLAAKLPGRGVAFPSLQPASVCLPRKRCICSSCLVSGRLHRQTCVSVT
ncbi:exo-alpha-sialidase [Trypanosoma cruzi]|nr:exo-alpha-sialidase [Trypanosoma cruzi]